MSQQSEMHQQPDPSKRPNLAQLQCNYQQSLMSHHELESLLLSTHTQLQQSNSELRLMKEQLAEERTANSATEALLSRLQQQEEAYRHQCTEQSGQIDQLLQLLQDLENQVQAHQEQHMSTAARLAAAECSRDELDQLAKDLQTRPDSAARLQSLKTATSPATPTTAALSKLLRSPYCMWLLLVVMQLPALLMLFISAVCISAPLLLLLAWCGVVGALVWIQIRIAIGTLRFCVHSMQQSCRATARYWQHVSISVSLHISNWKYTEDSSKAARAGRLGAKTVTGYLDDTHDISIAGLNSKHGGSCGAAECYEIQDAV